MNSQYFDLASFSRCRFENNVSFERRPVGDYRDEPGPRIATPKPSSFSGAMNHLKMPHS